MNSYTAHHRTVTHRFRGSAPAALRFALFWLSLLLMVGLSSQAFSADLQIRIGYLELIKERPPLLSNVLPEPEDSGLQGALLGMKDNNAGGRFLGQKFELLETRSQQLGELIEQARRWQNEGVELLLLNMDAEALLDLAGQFSPDQVLLFNVGSADNALRRGQCLPNLLHTLPSRAMLTDALAQWMKAKRLTDWMLIEGARPGDKAYADSLRRSAKRFGAKIVEKKQWSFDTDLRRSAQREVPLFTQSEDYDAVLVADELGDFGEFLLYNTWLPRPVAGTQGLRPVAWHRVVEQWGAAQLQKRFDKQAGRWMNSHDYAAWAAIRSIGEAVANSGKIDPISIRRQLLSEQFQLAGFKGRKLSYRSWNGQLRQPIALVHPRALVSQSPQEGFLHPVTELDTLGYDRRESQCPDLLAAADH
ncbi:ABC transporter substrate-binding protein [Motiliproteus sp.]|uniref:ABC transporter substrate-binding protein n=1 Tax=Motiliproteus sp. TaxID=1898955 RepID=UPI003BAB4835